VRRSYQQFCPVACALDVIGDRWSLLILRELAAGPRRFGDLERALAGIGPNLLTIRVGELTDAGLIEQCQIAGSRRSAYALTERGAAADAFLLPLARWGMPLLARADFSGADASLLPLAIRSMVRHEELDAHRLSVDLSLDVGSFRLEVLPAGPLGRRRPFNERISVVAASGASDAQVVMTGSVRALVGVSSPADLSYSGEARHVMRLRRALGLGGSPTLRRLER
jgi:DNA-binding HxlR family transcriptional regulator